MANSKLNPFNNFLHSTDSRIATKPVMRLLASFLILTLCLPLVFTSSNHLLAGEVFEFDTKVEISKPTEIGRFIHHKGAVNAVAVSRDGAYLATASSDKMSYILDTKKIKIVRKYGPHGNALNSVVWKKDKTIIYGGKADPTLKSGISFWDWKTRKRTDTMRDSNFEAFKLSMANDESKVAVSIGNGFSRIYPLPSQKRMGIETPRKDVKSRGTDFSADSRYYIVAIKGGHSRWLVTPQETRHAGEFLVGSDSTVQCLKYSPDMRTTVHGHADGIVRCIRETVGEEKSTFTVVELKGHTAGVNCAIFTFDGKWIITGSDDKTIKIWTADSFKLKHTISGHQGAVLGLALLKDGKTLVSASADKTVRLWDLTGKRKSLKSTKGIAKNTSNPSYTDYHLPEKRETHEPPSSKKLQEAIGLIQDIYKEEYAAAKTSTKKMTLANKIFKEASEEKNSNDERYALLIESRRLALEAGGVKLSSLATNEIIALYKTSDPTSLRIKLLEALSKKSLNRESRMEFTKFAIVIAEDTISEEKLDRSLSVARHAYNVSKRTNNKKLMSEAVALLKNVKAIQPLWVKYKAGIKTLNTKPTDAKANLDVARYILFIKADFEQGLKYAVKGDDKKLKQLATDDLLKPSEANQQDKVAAAWAAFAKTLDGRAKKTALNRSLHWYRLSAEGLTGLRKSKAERTIKRIEALIAELR